MTDADNVVREFVRHKIFRDVYAIERIAESSTVTTAARVDPRTVCRHRLADLVLNAEDAVVADLNASPGDYELADLPCLDAVHLLRDLGEHEKVCAEAARVWERKHGEAKTAKQDLDAAIARLRELVAHATDPAELPLFDRVEL